MVGVYLHKKKQTKKKKSEKENVEGRGEENKNDFYSDLFQKKARKNVVLALIVVDEFKVMALVVIMKVLKQRINNVCYVRDL